MNAGVESATNGSLGAGVTDAQIAEVSLIVFASQPLTWMLGYFVLEGAVRICGAAFAGNALGTLPLGIVDWAFGIFRKSEARPGKVAKRNVASFADGVKERMMEARSGNLRDELCYRKEVGEEILEIRASKKKAEWQAPKVVRVDDLLPAGGKRSEGRGTAILVPLEEIGGRSAWKDGDSVPHGGRGGEGIKGDAGGIRGEAIPCSIE